MSSSCAACPLCQATPNEGFLPSCPARIPASSPSPERRTKVVHDDLQDALRHSLHERLGEHLALEDWLIVYYEAVDQVNPVHAGARIGRERVRWAGNSAAHMQVRNVAGSEYKYDMKARSIKNGKSSNQQHGACTTHPASILTLPCTDEPKLTLTPAPCPCCTSGRTVPPGSTRRPIRTRTALKALLRSTGRRTGSPGLRSRC